MRASTKTRLFALAIAGLLLFPLIGKSGIWDPYELDMAEHARRIAIHLWGAKNLEVPGSLNTLPTLSDLQMGELPFTSVGLGFRLFGLHDWTGRLPLALWGFAGAAVLYELLARLVHRKAGLYACVALVTMPLYFLQARTMLGDIVSMSALIIAWSGLSGAMLDTTKGSRILWSIVACAGLLAGFMTRGLLIGVGIPALSTGFAWLVSRLSQPVPEPYEKASEPASDRMFTITGGLSLIVGAGASIYALILLSKTNPDAPLLRLLGFSLIKKAATEATFDLPIRQLGHALFPWSAFLPFAFGRMFHAPQSSDDKTQDRNTLLRISLLIGATLSLCAVAFIAPKAGQLPYPAAGLLAAILAISIYDLEQGAPPSRATAIGTLLLAFVLYRDMTLTPDKALAAFVVDKPTFPKSFELPSHNLLRITVLLFVSFAVLAWLDTPKRQPAAGLRAYIRERIEAYKEILIELSRVWNGNLAFSAMVAEAALVGLGAMLFIGSKLHWTPVAKLPKNFMQYGLNAWWALPLGLCLFLPVSDLLRDGYKKFAERLRFPKPAGLLVGALLAGSALSVIYYPALAAQLSPKEVFDAYTRVRKPGEPLALLGVQSRTATYYQGGGEVESFGDALRAFDWLSSESLTRRFLVARADDLPKLNSLYRKAFKQNIPVIDGRSSQIVLISNTLENQANQNTLAGIVLDTEPAPAIALDVLLEDQLEVLGWEVTDKNGRLQEYVIPQNAYHMRTYYRVLKPVSGNWKAFLHIDGYQRRYNGDHSILDGRYAMNLWQPGDVLMDDYIFQLEPNFTPGDYTVYFGLFSGDTRLRVARGANHENRIIGGVLRVR